MPRPALSPIPVDLLDSHDERILRLESDNTNLREDVAGVRSDVKHVQQTMNSVDRKIDTLQATMEKHATDTAERFTKVLDRVESLEENKKKADDDTALKLKARTERKTDIKKIAGWAAAGIGGVGLGKLGTMLAALLFPPG